MTADPRFLAVWTSDQLIPFPKQEWLDEGFPAEALPNGDEIPLDVAVVYTAYLTGDFGMFDTIQLATEEGSLDIRLIVVGAMADNTNLLYVLDPNTGEILQFDLDEQDIQAVNSNFKTFVEFLYRFAVFVEADEGKNDRPQRAQELQRTLHGIDPNAFHEDAWWPLVFEQLSS